MLGSFQSESVGQSRSVISITLSRIRRPACMSNISHVLPGASVMIRVAARIVVPGLVF